MGICQADGEGEQAGLEQGLLFNLIDTLVQGAGVSVLQSGCWSAHLKLPSSKLSRHLGVVSGFPQLPRKSSLHKVKGLLLEDDSGVLEHTVFRVGPAGGRDLPCARCWGLRDESGGLP